jgi:ketosteroid isomerase-like protein
MSPTIEARLRALEDERAILRTLYAYGQAIDYGREAEFLDCWTEDARLTYSFQIANSLGADGREDMSFTGREEIAGFFRRHTHAPERYHKHLLSAPQIVIDGDRATAECYSVRLDAQPGGPLASSFGRYRDELVRCPDGRWRFAVRQSETESRIAAALR